MDTNRIRAIIFDLGNVLIDFDYAIAAERLLAYTDKNPREIFDLFFDSQITGSFEEGKISPRDFFLKVKEKLNLRLDYNGFLPIWNEIFMLSEKNKAVYQLAGRLKDRYKLALLSNINILHFDYLKRSFPVFDVFHHVITSCQIGVRKPYPLIYQKTLEALEVGASNAFYTDDRAELVKDANRLGIRGFVFKNVMQLNNDLTSCGVTIN